MGAGWLLAAYGAPLPVWLATQAVTVHLAWVGSDAIALAIGWVIAIMWMLIAFKPWPSTWPIQVIGTPAQTWALTYLLLWIFSILLVFSLVFARSFLRTKGLQRKPILFYLWVITWGGLGMGGLIYGYGFS
ncbi:MAG: hypothetical protein O2890_09455 [Cyanobacteria bacterium]|nr:hypothetical protein [Cyanobacteriota bacterium]